MGQSISEVLPYAIGVAISPIPLIAVILMLFTPRAKANGTAFLLGWVLGLGVLATVVYVVANAANASTDNTASDSTSTVRVVLGVVLIVVALRRWRNRPGPGVTPEMPKWMAGVDRFTPAKAAGLGVLLGAVNPKNLVLTLGAAANLAQMPGLSSADAVAGIVAFVVIASSTTAACVAYRVFGGDRSRARLDDAKLWLTNHNDAVMMVLFLVFGVVLVAQGTGRLSA
ncbi:MAG: GAP family protein [Actinobacteria bacterium]|nr:GAP family protein [Actinomycetota bacterium]